MQIMLIDDEADIRLLVGRFLKKEGHEVQKAATLEEAREKLQGDYSPDVILLDLNLPDGSGLDLAREIADANFTALIILQSAYLAQATRETLSELPIAGTLHKPYNYKDLRPLLQEIEAQLNDAK